MERELICPSCGITFIGKGWSRKFCSPKCKGQFNKKPHVPVKGSPYYHRVTKNNPELRSIHNERGRLHRQLVFRWLANYKLSKGCIDCGYSDFACALQLDHNGPKTNYIANIRSSIPRLQKEIEDGRCEVRCGNCHAIKTWNERWAK